MPFKQTTPVYCTKVWARQWNTHFLWPEDIVILYNLLLEHVPNNPDSTLYHRARLFVYSVVMFAFPEALLEKKKDLT